MMLFHIACLIFCQTFFGGRISKNDHRLLDPVYLSLLVSIFWYSDISLYCLRMFLNSENSIFHHKVLFSPLPYIALSGMCIGWLALEWVYVFGFPVCYQYQSQENGGCDGADWYCFSDYRCLCLLNYYDGAVVVCVRLQ
jgi:hypothetical protein